MDSTNTVLWIALHQSEPPVAALMELRAGRRADGAGWSRLRPDPLWRISSLPETRRRWVATSGELPPLSRERSAVGKGRHHRGAATAGRGKMEGRAQEEPDATAGSPLPGMRSRWVAAIGPAAAGTREMEGRAWEAPDAERDRLDIFSERGLRFPDLDGEPNRMTSLFDASIFLDFSKILG